MVSANIQGNPSTKSVTPESAPVVSSGPAQPESAGQTLARLGTDAQAWAREFVARFGGDEGLMIAWFASAIETGRSASQGRPLAPAREAAATRVFEALGAASMCWSHSPVGVFNSTRAGEIGNDLLAFLGYEEADS